ASFIRSQLARAALPRWDPRVLARDLNERAILRDHEKAWRAELPTFAGVRYGGFERGLVSWLLFDDAALLPAHIAAAMAACPAPGLDDPRPPPRRATQARSHRGHTRAHGGGHAAPKRRPRLAGPESAALDARRAQPREQPPRRQGFRDPPRLAPPRAPPP